MQENAELKNANWSLIPEHCREGLERYIREGVETGSFLMAVLENDLRRAVECADFVNRQTLPGYVMFLNNYAPSGCWGSPQKVGRWVSQGGLKGASSRASVDPELGPPYKGMACA